MVTATLDGIVIAEAANPPVVEGNYYFPPDSIKQEYFKPTDTSTVCGWKGTASYYSVQIGDKTVTDAAWYYPEPKSAAQNIKGHVAFYKNKVTIKA